MLLYTQTFRNHLQAVLDGRAQSSCRLILLYANEMYFSQKGYRDVPDTWHGAYYEYRIRMSDVFAILGPVAANCPPIRDSNDAQFNAEEAAKAMTLLDGILSRVPQILNETAGLP